MIYDIFSHTLVAEYNLQISKNEKNSMAILFQCSAFPGLRAETLFLRVCALKGLGLRASAKHAN